MMNSISIPQRTKLALFYVNDMHGRDVSGMIEESDKFDNETKNKGMDVLKLSGGDNFSGANKKRNQMMVELLARMGIKDSALGNHEMDSGLTEGLFKYLNPKTNFLAANANVPVGSPFYEHIQKSTVVETNGHKYGIIGLMPFDLERVMGADDKKMEGVRPKSIEQSIQAVNDEAKKLEAQGVNKIIVVSHIGNDKDKEIAPHLHGVDVIVGGHSHTEVNGVTSDNLFQNADGKPILILQTGENARNVGEAFIEFDENGVPVAAENKLVPTKQEQSLFVNYLEEAKLGKSPKIGFLTEVEPLPKNRRIIPCAWTNLMCDAMREGTGADIAIINAANTRKVPKRGIFTERDVSESTPLKNTILVKKITEKEIVRALKESLAETYNHETSEPGILHASGLSYVADTKGNLRELSFVDKSGQKTPIDIENPTDKAYSVAYDSFIAKGTEYPVFVPQNMTYKQIDKTYDFDKDKFLIDYIKAMPDKKSLKVKDDGRIKILDENGETLKVGSRFDNTAPKKPKGASKAAPTTTAAPTMVTLAPTTAATIAPTTTAPTTGTMTTTTTAKATVPTTTTLAPTMATNAITAPTTTVASTEVQNASKNSDEQSLLSAYIVALNPKVLSTLNTGAAIKSYQT